MNLELLGYSSIGFEVFIMRCEIILSKSSNNLGQTLEFLCDEQSLECTKRSYKNKSDLED
jgi:hypothetical protein